MLDFYLFVCLFVVWNDGIAVIWLFQTSYTTFMTHFRNKGLVKLRFNNTVFFNSSLKTSFVNIHRRNVLRVFEQEMLTV